MFLFSSFLFPWGQHSAKGMFSGCRSEGRGRGGDSLEKEAGSGQNTVQGDDPGFYIWPILVLPTLLNPQFSGLSQLGLRLKKGAAGGD